MENRCLENTIDKILNKKNNNTEIIKNISIEKVTEFKGHPFKVRDDEEMKKLVQSVKEYGVLNPILVRPKTNGEYEIISGHRRKRATEIARKKEIPAIVRNLSDDEATIIMVDSNLQREEILPSEKAFAYKMKLEAIKHQGKKKISSAPMEQKLEKGQTSRELIAEQTNESREQVRRYIRLTELIPKILNMVDEKKIAFRPAVEISYLNTEQQEDLFDIMQYSDSTPSLAQAIRLKNLSQEKALTTEKIDEIMSEDKPNQIPKFKINQDILNTLLPDSIKTDKQVENFIINCIREHNQRQKQREVRQNERYL